MAGWTQTESHMERGWLLHVWWFYIGTGVVVGVLPSPPPYLLGHEACSIWIDSCVQQARLPLGWYGVVQDLVTPNTVHSRFRSQNFFLGQSAVSVGAQPA